MKSLSEYILEAGAGSITPANKRWGVTPEIQNEGKRIIEEFSKYMGEKLYGTDHLWKRGKYYSTPWREASVRFNVVNPDEAKRYDKFHDKLYKEFSVQGIHTGNTENLLAEVERWKDDNDFDAFEKRYSGKDFNMFNKPFILEGTNTQINGVKFDVSKYGGYYDTPLEKMVVEITFRIINTDVNLK